MGADSLGAVSEGLERAALVALLRLGRRRSAEYAALVEEAGSALAIFARERDAGRLETQTSFGAVDLLASTEEDLAEWQAAGFELVTVLDDDYPANLRAVYQHPPLLFVAGKLEYADERSVAVIGTRTPSPRGEKAAAQIAHCLLDSDYAVVSGLASGIDSAVHRAAIAAGGRPVAVIGTGLRLAYPPENRALQEQLSREYAVASQFLPDTPARKQNFRDRNGLMAGLTLATMIVEASPTSGTRIQARWALDHGRPVLLWHELLKDEWALQLAQRPGTHVVRRAEEVPTTVERLASLSPLVA